MLSFLHHNRFSRYTVVHVLHRIFSYTTNDHICKNDSYDLLVFHRLYRLKSAFFVVFTHSTTSHLFNHLNELLRGYFVFFRKSIFTRLNSSDLIAFYIRSIFEKGHHFRNQYSTSWHSIWVLVSAKNTSRFFFARVMARHMQSFTGTNL